MKKKLKIGSRVLVEQAWEDEAGNYHDAFAVVERIQPDGELTLSFEEPNIQEFLRGCDGYTKDNVELVD